MIFSSLKTNISIGFFIAFILFLAAFIPFLKFEEDSISKEIQSKHKAISDYAHFYRLNPYELEEYILSLNFKKVEDVRRVLDGKKTAFSTAGYESFRFEDKLYFHIRTPHFRILFEDSNKYEKNIYPYVMFIMVFFLLMFIYLWILKALKPLSILKKEIKQFANGEYETSSKSDGKDEIAQVVNEFNNMAKKTSLLLNSRQLFLRTIMHELKTPIAKGRIVSELIDDEKQKNRMVNIFENLDSLVNDFSRIEKVVSQNYKLNTNTYELKKVLDKAFNFMMIDENDERILLNIDRNIRLKVDLDLMAMVLKNLCDNALKYSSDKKVQIHIKEKSILFISNGNRLEKNLEEYFKPFHNSTENKNHGMGLGLYIVKSILDLHKMSISHKFDNNKNVFEITFN
ncbi:ArsS family sensor histidine kinase [Arcobacter roscoffensis]|uniref:histidine kinase n=1 Tax=Arcobacter roscoffensis TaxID=2961520 RepID=A0ABY5E182_9BACT|nr:ArsS family sensor histidine kinase [Arcobacter roscoffensis]UTJ05475.1 ArsS family sensor histidine kinase [Arcobacter roscoffensis]